MTDEQVGELWKEARGYLTRSNQERLWMLDLICKLVEERARFYTTCTRQSLREEISRALGGFGIPEEEFNEWELQANH